MPVRIGIIAYPLLLLILAFGRNTGTVSRFVKAGAISPPTARKPASVGIKYPELMERPVRKNMLIATGDGRYYANMALVARKRRQMMGLATAALLLVAALGLLAWHPWM
jgi:hypothetical protein